MLVWPYYTYVREYYCLPLSFNHHWDQPPGLTPHRGPRSCLNEASKAGWTAPRSSVSICFPLIRDEVHIIKNDRETKEPQKSGSSGFASHAVDPLPSQRNTFFLISIVNRVCMPYLCLPYVRRQWKHTMTRPETFSLVFVVALSEKGSFRSNLVCVEIVVAGTTRGKEED